jgi:hypothetical protein
VVTTPKEEEERPAPAEPTRPESPAQPLSPPYSAAEDQELDEDQQELQRLREELAALHQQFESPGRRQRQITVLRQVVAAVLVFVAALGVTMSVVGVWAGNTILNTADGPDFARANLDPLRICGVVAAGILLLFTSWAGLFWILVLLGVYELLMTAVAAAGHGPAGGEASSQAPDAGRTSRSSGLIA